MSENVNNEMNNMEINNAKKPWELRTTQEKLESIYNSEKAIIAIACKEKKQVWNQNMSNEELDNTMPYNAMTGNPIYGKHEVLCRSIIAIKEYKTPQFIDFGSAMKLGAVLKENEIPLKISKMQDTEYKVFINRDGNPIIDKEKPEITDKDGNKIPNYKKYRAPLAERTVITFSYYNIEQFKNPEVFKEHLKERDMTSVYKFRENVNETGNLPKIHEKLKPLKLNNKTEREIEHFIINRTVGLDHMALHKESAIEIKKEQEKPKTRARTTTTRAKKQENGMER